ncbi:hypothetical protein EV359DRAFT_15884, partial [Lentinula novae-zelandiae]
VVVGVLASILGLGSLSRGQTTNASCAPSFSWAENSLQQSPCLVAALLESQCDPFGGWLIPALPASNHYTGPSSGQATTCECSTLTYMLISACGACQNRTWISWQNWSQNCPIIELSVFPVPLPPTTDVPLWAYMNISTAHATLSQPTSTSDNASSSSPSSQTSSLFISTSTTVLSSTTTTVNPTSSVSSASPNHAGAIAGGVVGGLTLLVALALVLLWFCVKRKRNA